MGETQNTCGLCSRWMQPECPYLKDAQEKIIKPSDTACDAFEMASGTPSGGRVSQADKLILYCLAQKPELFHDQTKTTYARISQSSVNVTLPIRSKSFKAWLANLLWQAEAKAPGTEALYGAINILEAKALFEGKEYYLYNRVAPAEDGIWIDMADDKWRAIKVTAEGWSIVGEPPILFKRYSHQQPLVEPKANGDPTKFLDFVNIADEDEYTRLTTLVAIISYLIPGIPHPILTLYGIQGSGKSCLFKLVRRLIDPSAVEVLTLQRDERERVQQLDHHWCAFYDNVGALPSWMSDTLCRAATGGGFTKRELYSDDHDIIYNFKRCVGINGINIAAQRGDLLDRILLVGLKAIPQEKRRTEEELFTEFENSRAEILGGFLNTLVEAFRIYPTINPKKLFRMADFTRWGCAITKALGRDPEEFIEAYDSKVKAQIEEAAHASPVATVLIDFMETFEKEWDGTPSQLFTTLLNHAKELGISAHQKAWPKAPHVLVRQLNELAPSLKQLGWEVVTGVWSGSTRRIIVNSVGSVGTVGKDAQSNDATDATNAISPTSSREISVQEAIVTELPSSEGVKAPVSTLKSDGVDVEKPLDTPQQLGNLSNLVTNPSAQEAIEYALSQMAKRLPDKSTESDFVHDLQFKGLSEEEAEKLLDKLTSEGPLSYDGDGWLVKR